MHSSRLVQSVLIVVLLGAVSLTSGWGYRQVTRTYLDEDADYVAPVTHYVRQESSSSWSLIDSYNIKDCGLFDGVTDWHKEQNAFNCVGGVNVTTPWMRSNGFGRNNQSPCPSRASLRPLGSHSKARYPNSSSNRLLDGTIVKPGEFPAHVQLLIVNSPIFNNDPETANITCGGVLIHDDLVLTSKDCLGNADGVTLTFGSTHRDGRGGVKREAVEWCYWVRNTPWQEFSLIKFSPRIQLVPNKIWPACIVPSVSHRDDVQVVAVGSGLTDDLTKPSEKLRKITMKRKCTKWDATLASSCYTPTSKEAGTCRGDSGGGIYAWDTCFKDKKPRAFLVGLITDYQRPKNCIRGQTHQVYANELASMQKDFNDMLHGIRHNKEYYMLQCHKKSDIPTYPPRPRPKSRRAQ